jgi:hypothetical protein
MQKALGVYGQVLRLVRRLPKDSRPYYAKYARENFVNYRDVEANDTQFLDELFLRAYNHSLWVLNKVPFSYAFDACLLMFLVNCFKEFLFTEVHYECSIRLMNRLLLSWRRFVAARKGNYACACQVLVVIPQRVVTNSFVFELWGFMTCFCSAFNVVGFFAYFYIF